MLGVTQPPRMDPPIEEKKSSLTCKPPTPKRPKSPKKNVIRQIFNASKKLRYSMKMDAVHPEDEDRNFILEYNLSDGTILINERAKINSGRRGGKFLSAMLIPKPGTDKEDPLYYTPEDFFIGAKINAFNHYFIITGADLFVHRYIEANPEKFSQQLKDNMRNYFVQQGLLQDDINALVERTKDEEVVRGNLNQTIEDHKDSFNMEHCMKDSENGARRRYKGEHGELRSPTSPSEELCSNLIPVERQEIDNVNSSEIQTCEKSTRKEIKWADQVLGNYFSYNKIYTYAV